MRHVLIFKYRNSDPGKPDSLTYNEAVVLPHVGDRVSGGAGPEAEVSTIKLHYEGNQINVVIELAADDPAL